MKTTNRIRTAVIAAMILLIMMCSVTVFAAESAGGRDSGLVSQSQTAEGIPEEETEIEFFDGLKAGNHLRDTLFVIGAIFTFAGVAGFICMYLWRRANRRRDRTQETREGILNEIEQAEQRNRRQKEREQKESEKIVEAALQPEDDTDLFDTQENDFFAEKPAEIVQETPLVPSTPVSMQPNEKPRPRMQTGSLPQPVQPITVKPVQTAVKPAEPAPAAEPTAEQPKKPAKYDLDDILREVREGKI